MGTLQLKELIKNITKHCVLMITGHFWIINKDISTVGSANLKCHMTYTRDVIDITDLLYQLLFLQIGKHSKYKTMKIAFHRISVFHYCIMYYKNPYFLT